MHYMTAHELANILLQMPDVKVQIAVPNSRQIMEPLTDVQVISSPGSGYWEVDKKNVLLFGAYYNYTPNQER